MEKMHIVTDRNPTDNKNEDAYFKDAIPELEIFDLYSCNYGDLFRNIYIFMMDGMKDFPNVLFLYKQAFRLLLNEPRSIIHNVYRINANERKAIDAFLK
jgi:hypothetical protein